MLYLSEISDLQELIDRNIMESDSVRDMLMSKQLDKIKKLYPYAIMPPKDAGARWQTCCRDNKGNRKNVKAQTETAL